MILKKHASLFLISVTIALLFVFLVFSSSASNSAKNGIYLCLNTVIPSLFPIFVVNGMLISSGTANRISDFLKLPISTLFGVSENGVYPTILGILCGAPSGSVALSSVIDSKNISQEEATIIAVVSSPISFSFLYSTLGGKMLGSYKLGIILYVICLISSTISGRILSVIVKSKIKTSCCSPQINMKNSFPRPSLGKAISDAVTSTLSICGTIVFFSAISGLICSVPNIPTALKTSFTLFLEITSGAQSTALQMQGSSAFLFICAGVGWSGLSIICQCISSLGKNISFYMFCTGKCLTSLISLVIGLAVTALGIV